MTIKSGRYIITHAQYYNLAFLSNDNDGTSLLGCLERDVPGQEWNVKELQNGRYSIINFGHKMSASTGFRPQKGEHAVGRERDWLWLIKEHHSGGKYAIATADEKLRWWLDDSWPETPITLHDAPPSDPRCLWTFQKIVRVNITQSEAAKEELEAVKAEVVRKAGKVEQAKQEVGQANAELARMAKEAKEAKREVKQAKAEVVRTLAELEAARREAAAAKALAAGNAEVKDEPEVEVHKWAAGAEQTKRNAAQTNLWDARWYTNIFSKPDTGRHASTDVVTGQLDTIRYTRPKVVTGQLDTGQYTITNVVYDTVATFSDVVTEFYVTGGLRGAKEWGIVSLGNEKYTIRSIATGKYATYARDPGEGMDVFGSRSTVQWTIKMMQSPGSYLISPGDTHLYWSLPNGKEGTKIEFSIHGNSPASQWFFVKVD